MLYATVGLARCGKSSFADGWSSVLAKRTVISGDDIRLALTGQRFNPAAEPMVQSIKCCAIRSLLLLNFTVLHDGTNTSMNSVVNLEKLVESVFDKVVWVIFNTPKDVCQNEAIKSNQEDLIEVIERMNKNFQPTTSYLVDKYKGDGAIIIPRSRIRYNNIMHIKDKNKNITLTVTDGYDTITRNTNIILVDYFS